MADTNSSLVVISRKEAQARGLKRFFTGKPCKHGHISERLACNYRCIACHDALIGVNRQSHHANFRRWYEKNRESQRERMRKGYYDNKEKRSEYAKRFRAEHPEQKATQQRNREARKRQNGGKHTATDIKEIGRLQKGRCAYFFRCGHYLKDGYHVDHIEPVSRGGSNLRSNLQLLCPACNLTKQAIDPIDFMKSQGRLL